MTALGKHLVAAAKEANGKPWVQRPAPKPRKSAAATTAPEWVLQAAMIAEFHKCQAEGYKFRAAGDMNAGRRGRWAAAQAKAMGLNRGETDIRLYGSGGRLLLVEVKTAKAAKGKRSGRSVDQERAHDEFAELGFEVLIAAPEDEAHARALAREIAVKFCAGGGGL